jgi:hypothetical protein
MAFVADSNNPPANSRQGRDHETAGESVPEGNPGRYKASGPAGIYKPGKPMDQPDWNLILPAVDEPLCMSEAIDC